MVEGKCIHIGNLIPKTALLSQKEALRESNFNRYGRGMVERWQRNLQSSSESSISEISSSESSDSVCAKKVCVAQRNYWISEHPLEFSNFLPQSILKYIF
jgi:hypothetical protein